MAFITLTQAFYVLVIYTAYRIIFAIHGSRQLNNFAKAHGCEKPLDVSGPWPFSLLKGFSQFRRIIKMKETGEDILDNIIMEDFRDASTVQSTQIEGSVNLTTIEPVNLQAILATQFKDFEIGQQRINTFFPLLRQSIFSSDGSYWEHSRALFRPQFNRDQINDLGCTEETSQALIKAIGPVDASGWTQECDLQPLLFDFTLDTATDFLFGESVKSLSFNTNSGAEKTHSATQQAATKQFKDDFELASRYMIQRIRLQSAYWLADGIKFRRAVSRIRRFTEHFVQKAIDSTSTVPEKEDSKKKYDLLSALATQTHDRNELRDQTMAILAAGRDTTASLLGWVFLRLTLHPQTFTRLRAEILTSFPATEPITFTSLKSCRYLQHFINEVLRLHPTVPFNNRTAACTTTLPTGGGPTRTAPIAVPKGQVVAFSVYLMHRRKDLWGEDALEFRPERWTERKIPAWQFLPFSGGPRVCLGMQFALTETSYVIVKMLREFDRIEAVDREEMGRMRKMLGLTMWPDDGVRVRLHKAKS